jgi:cytochrome c oxidase subunit II
VVDTRAEFRTLADVYLPIAAGVFVLVLGLVLVFAWRYRARDGEPARAGGPTEHPSAEILYVVVLACVAAFLVGFTFRHENRVDRVVTRDVLRVDVSAGKWTWRFAYPRYGIAQTNTLVVPTGTRVLFTLTSRDVIHSFWIPERRFKRDAFPEQATRFDLVFDRAGNFPDGGACAEYCGLHHAEMRFTVRALAPDAFQAWARAR